MLAFSIDCYTAYFYVLFCILDASIKVNKNDGSQFYASVNLFQRILNKIHVLFQQHDNAAVTVRTLRVGKGFTLDL